MKVGSKANNSSAASAGAAPKWRLVHQAITAPNASVSNTLADRPAARMVSAGTRLSYRKAEPLPHRSASAAEDETAGRKRRSSGSKGRAEIAWANGGCSVAAGNLPVFRKL